MLHPPPLLVKDILVTDPRYDWFITLAGTSLGNRITVVINLLTIAARRATLTSGGGIPDIGSGGPPVLRHSPRLTPASHAARRANALKSTGPRTAELLRWPRRISAIETPGRVSSDLMSRHYCIACCGSGHVERRIDRLALRIWRLTLGTHSTETKLLSHVFSAGNRL